MRIALHGSSARRMDEAIAYLFVPSLSVCVWKAGDVPVMIIFIGLA